MATMTATTTPTTDELENLARLVRYYSMVSTTKAGSATRPRRCPPPI